MDALRLIRDIGKEPSNEGRSLPKFALAPDVSSHECAQLLCDRGLKYLGLTSVPAAIDFLSASSTVLPTTLVSPVFRNRRIRNIGIAMSKHDVDNLAREASKGMLEEARQRAWPTHAPLGYRNVVGPAGKRISEFDAVEAPLIQSIFEWYATGDYSLLQVAERPAEVGRTKAQTQVGIPRSCFLWPSWLCADG